MWRLVLDPRISLLPVVVLNSIALIGYFLLRAKKNTLLYLYIFLNSLISIWAVGQIMEVLAPDRQSIWFAVQFKYFGICFISLDWLLLCGIYTRHKLFASKELIYLLSLPPLLFYLALLTNERHFMFFSAFDHGYTAYGIIFWFHTGFSYIYLIAGIIMLITKAAKELGKAFIRPVLLIIAALIPFAANLVIITNFIFDLYIFNRMDITPICFSVSLLLFSIATFRYRFLNVVPIALRRIMDNMREVIVIIDNFGKIVDFNPAFQNAFPAYTRNSDNGIKPFADFLRQNCENTNEARAIIDAVATGTNAYIDGELCLLKPGKTHYFVYVQPIYYGRQKTIHGTVVLFNDITSFKNLLEELQDKNEEISAMNEELASMNEQLRDHARVLGELAVTRERNRIARDTHDTLGQTMALLISLLEVCTITCRDNPAKTEEKLLEAKEIAKNGIRELRRSLRGLTAQAPAIENLGDLLKGLIREYSASGMRIDLSCDKRLEDLHNPQLACAIYRICQEAMTNSLRHGKAKNMKIVLASTDGAINLLIEDDGMGCGEIKKGWGLTGMEERVAELKGKIEYGLGRERGFRINIEIPLAGPEFQNEVER